MKEQPKNPDNLKRRILVVDDENDLRILLSDMLLGAGYEVVSAADGEEAIGLLGKNETIDVALLDIQMPIVNGIEVLKHIKNNHPSVRAVMLTGFADLKYAMEAREFGARDFINKPYRVEDILATIRRVLQD
jgi:DNA-binding NtrC family response regulator